MKSLTALVFLGLVAVAFSTVYGGYGLGYGLGYAGYGVPAYTSTYGLGYGYGLGNVGVAKTYVGGLGYGLGYGYGGLGYSGLNYWRK